MYNFESKFEKIIPTLSFQRFLKSLAKNDVFSSKLLGSNVVLSIERWTSNPKFPDSKPHTHYASHQGI